MDGPVSFRLACLPHLFQLLLAGGCRNLNCVACFPERTVGPCTGQEMVRLSEEPGGVASLASPLTGGEDKVSIEISG